MLAMLSHNRYDWQCQSWQNSECLCINAYEVYSYKNVYFRGWTPKSVGLSSFFIVYSVSEVPKIERYSLEIFDWMTILNIICVLWHCLLLLPFWNLNVCRTSKSVLFLHNNCEEWVCIVQSVYINKTFIKFWKEMLSLKGITKKNMGGNLCS